MRWGTFGVLIAVSLVGSACGWSVTGQSDGTEGFVSGDGVLDCEDGQVARGAGVYVTADSELGVVTAALEPWIGDGGDLVELSAGESWTAVLGGRDVAIVVPELDGTGAWVTHDVITCGDPDTGPAAIDGELDCANDYRWLMQAALDPSIPGDTTAEEAITRMLEPFAKRYGGEVVLVDERTGSLVVDQREQVVTRVSEVEAGGWGASGAEACEGFDL